VDDLTKQILLKEIELGRFNVHFKMEAARQGRWKGWRYFLSQESNAALTDAGLIVGIKERMGKIHRPKNLNPHTLQHGLVPQAVGQTIGAAGSAWEFLVNEYHEVRAHQLGFSPGAAKKHVMQLRDEIDRLLAERDALVQIESAAPLLTTHAAVDSAEGRVLRDIRDLNLVEYSQWHIGARRLLAFQQSLYLLDIAKNTTGAVGNWVAKHSIHVKRRTWNAPAGMLTTISGALIILTPLLSRATGMLVGSLHQHLIAGCTKDCLTRDVAQLDADLLKLQQLCQSPECAREQVASSVAHLAQYKTHDENFMTQYHQRTKEAHAGLLAASENIFTGAFVGGTKVATGVNLTVAGVKYTHSARITNSLIGSGTIAYCVGTSWALLDNPRIQLKREWVNYKLGKQHQLPGQMLKDRLNRLDQMEAAIKGAGSS